MWAGWHKNHLPSIPAMSFQALQTALIFQDTDITALTLSTPRKNQPFRRVWE